MDIKDALLISLEQIVNKLEALLYLDDNSVTQNSLEAVYIENKFVENTKLKSAKFSGIYDVERAHTLMCSLIVDKDSIIDSLEHVNTKHIKALELKEKKLNDDISECSSYIMHVSSIIDTALYNDCKLLNFKCYNYFGFKKAQYKALLQNAQYRSTTAVVADNVFHEVFTGKSIVSEYYTPVFSLPGVVNKVPRDKLEYKLHRLICLLVKMDRRELASVLCRLLLTQIDTEDKIDNNTTQI